MAGILRKENNYTITTSLEKQNTVVNMCVDLYRMQKKNPSKLYGR